jgi:hypothetical protein
MISEPPFAYLTITFLQLFATAKKAVHPKITDEETNEKAVLSHITEGVCRPFKVHCVCKNIHTGICI